MFDYSTDVFHVPHAYARFIVDPKQRHIQHIVDRVGLSGLKISDVGDVVDLPGYVTFRLTGTRRAIHDARMFLEFHIASLQELDKLRGVEAPPGIHSAKDGAENNQTEAVVRYAFFNI